MRNSRAGLFLDLDGTLADSIGAMRTAYDSFLECFGRSGSVEEFSRLNGPPLATVVRELAAAHDLAETENDLLKVYLGLVEGAYLKVAPRVGALELLSAARTCGVTIGVVTSNREPLSRQWLRSTNLLPMIQVVVCGEHVQRGKPAPDPYLMALKKSGCDAQLSLAVEDSMLGARSAVAAGIRTLLLGGTDADISAKCMPVNSLTSVIEFIKSE